MSGTTTSVARAVLLLGVLTCGCGATQSATLRNPDFEEVVNGVPAEWTAGGDAGAVAGTSDTSSSGDRAMRITTPNGGSYSSFSQSLRGSQFVGQKVRLQGFIRTEQVSDGHAILWMRIDGKQGSLGLANMSGRGLSGTTPWAEHEVVLYIVPGSEEIICGGLLRGRGAAWFDDFRLSVLPPPRGDTSADASRYLNAALDLIEIHALQPPDLGWATLRETAYEIALGATEPQDTHLAIRQALGMLGDRHSRLMTAAEIRERTGRTAPGAVPPPPDSHSALEVRILEDRFALVPVPAFRDLSPERKRAFATDLQAAIGGAASRNPCGWIVDLRGNDGGTMWPMLAGIGPLLGDGTAGWFSKQDGDEGTPWGYRDGAAWLGARDLVKVESPVRFPAAPRPVAVLIGPRTSSAGEAVAVAFDGLPNVRSFGHKTSGQATSTTVCPLSDGAVLVVASSEFVGRTGRRVAGGVLPDEQTEGPADSPNGEDRTLAAALDWIRSQEPCDDNTPRAADADQ